MSIKSTFHFNERKYRDKISKDDTDTLIRKHSVKTMRYSACGVGVAIGAGVALMSGPIAGPLVAIGPIYTGRQAVINRKQQRVIEKELDRREKAKPRIRKRDVGLGAAIGGATALVGYVIAPVVIDHLATAPLVDLASSAATPHATHVTGHAAAQAAQTFGRGIQDTFVTQAHEAAAPFVHHTMNTAVKSFANNGPFYALGVHATIAGERVATSSAAGYGLEKAGTQRIQNGKRREV